STAPLCASSAYTVSLSVAAYTRPLKTSGCAYTAASSDAFHALCRRRRSGSDTARPVRCELPATVGHVEPAPAALAPSTSTTGTATTTSARRFIRTCRSAGMARRLRDGLVRALAHRADRGHRPLLTLADLFLGRKPETRVHDAPLALDRRLRHVERAAAVHGDV